MTQHQHKKIPRLARREVAHDEPFEAVDLLFLAYAVAVIDQVVLVLQGDVKALMDERGVQVGSEVDSDHAVVQIDGADHLVVHAELTAQPAVAKQSADAD